MPSQGRCQRGVLGPELPPAQGRGSRHSQGPGLLPSPWAGRGSTRLVGGLWVRVCPAGGEGPGGPDELAEKFSTTSIMYGLCRVQDPGTGTHRIVLINWVSAGVGALGGMGGTGAGYIPNRHTGIPGSRVTAAGSGPWG
uniref:ADF-H domain-containing protein n=1 Tax=Falco tinnunculus TaxID=100819 RepID=A0A8C4V805_FALTI